jgi:hypothetical protein
MHNFVLVGFILTLVSAVNRPYEKIIPDGSPDARCLDGTPPAIYMDWGDSDSNYLIFFMGGGYCAGV